MNRQNGIQIVQQMPSPYRVIAVVVMVGVAVTFTPMATCRYSKETQMRTGNGIDPRAIVGNDWLRSLHDFSEIKGPKSQGSQDIYFFSIFDRIGTTNRYFVEFGFNEASYSSGGSGANTRNLYDHGWRGLLIDGGKENLAINLRKHLLYQDNIAEIFRTYGVPRELDYLSCDMDSHDLFVLEAILKGGYHPRLITTEFNANYPLGVSITQVDPTLEPGGSSGYTFKFKECAWGASATALKSVADKYGYTLIGRVSLLDLIWLRNDLVKSEWVVPPFEWFFSTINMGILLHGKQTSDDIFNYVMDYGVYTSTGDLTAAKKAAKDALLPLRLPCYREINTTRA